MRKILFVILLAFITIFFSCKEEPEPLSCDVQVTLLSGDTLFNMERHFATAYITIVNTDYSSREFSYNPLYLVLEQDKFYTVSVYIGSKYGLKMKGGKSFKTRKGALTCDVEIDLSSY